MNSYFTGIPASLTTNPVSLLHAVHMIIGVGVLSFSYAFINIYLNRKHSIKVTLAEINNPSKNMFSLKTLIVVAVFTLTSVIVIIFFQTQQQSFPVGAIITSLFLTLVNFYFASKTYIVEHFLAKLKRQQNRLEELPVVRIPATFRLHIPRQNQINVME